MKLVKLAVAAVLALVAGTAYAFHSGGVAECEGCHSMHNSFEGSPNVTGRTFAQGTGPYLLKANDQSGACLNCHQAADVAPTSYHISTAGVNPYDGTTPVEATPGGDFAWLKKTLTITIRRNTATRDAERYGHNVVAADFGYVVDGVVTTAPGGTYPSSALGCHSCHDPHGRYRRFADGTYATSGLPIFNSGSYNNSADPIATVSAVGAYRILGGIGYQPKSLAGSYAFVTNPMDVVVASGYNRYETTSQTGIAYGNNVSEWCANCHTDILQNSYTSGMAGLRHPAGNSALLKAEIVANYNAYVSSGIMTNTNPAAAFSTLAPFQVNSADRAVLKPYAVTASSYTTQNMPAASTSHSVMCLSCHRAHASAFESSLRAFYLNEFRTIADASNVAIYDPSTTENKINYGLTAAQQQVAYYGRPATVFGPYARSYCNKCHAKD
ncbi:MAG TPA: cytochrome C [Anaeromyxobacteraceae bacterium]|nr:cytochrome C [Anaeromyxobacteraceae bacterium]